MGIRKSSSIPCLRCFVTRLRKPQKHASVPEPAKKNGLACCEANCTCTRFALKLQCRETVFSLLPNDLHLLALREAYSAAQNNAPRLARLRPLALLLKMLAQLLKAQGFLGVARRTNRRHRRLGRAGRTGPR